MRHSVLVRVPQEWEPDFRQFWKHLRMAEGLPATYDLQTPQLVDRFDGAALAEWIVPLAEHGSALVGVVLGYLIARRGEIEIGDKKFKNISIQNVKEILNILDNLDGRKDGKVPKSKKK
ncbi:hypothetical protein [Desertibaculum subflavum]|uniref:hypothetical protein n=1 Tax=Desertibaculum subflavum TaxID=2268458 RepID=UPI0013C47A75